MENFAHAANITIPAEASLGAWDSFGGKLLVGALVLAFLLYSRRGKEKHPVASPT